MEDCSKVSRSISKLRKKRTAREILSLFTPEYTGGHSEFYFGAKNSRVTSAKGFERLDVFVYTVSCLGVKGNLSEGLSGK